MVEKPWTDWDTMFWFHFAQHKFNSPCAGRSRTTLTYLSLRHVFLVSFIMFLFQRGTCSCMDPPLNDHSLLYIDLGGQLSSFSTTTFYFLMILTTMATGTSSCLEIVSTFLCNYFLSYLLHTVVHTMIPNCARRTFFLIWINSMTHYMLDDIVVFYEENNLLETSLQSNYLHTLHRVINSFDLAISFIL